MRIEIDTLTTYHSNNDILMTKTGGRGKREEGRGKREERRGKREERRGKREEGREKREERKDQHRSTSGQNEKEGTIPSATATVAQNIVVALGAV